MESTMQSFDVPYPKRSRTVETLATSAASAPVATTWTNTENNDLLPTSFFQDDQWQDVFIPLPLEDASPGSVNTQSAASRKRPRSGHVEEGEPSESSDAALGLMRDFPGLIPDGLCLPIRSWGSEIPNPFLEQDTLKHPRLRQYAVPVAIPEDGYISGLIKIRLNLSKYKKAVQPVARLQKFPWKKPRFVIPEIGNSFKELSRLPPDFGRGLKLNGITEKFFEFFRIAICGAATLIPDQNCYLSEIIPIAVKSDCVKHAILALAATYILDYSGEENVKSQANFHWKRAIHLLSRELTATESCKPGKENAVLAAMTLIAHNENVNWECSEASGQIPPWYKATHLAERILEKSDPLYDYHSPANIQCSRARIQLGNKMALYNIMSAAVSPLEKNQTKCSFTWLIEGQEHELRQIVGSTGLCPRLLHTFAQITHLSAKLYIDPRRMAARKLGAVIGTRLDNFWQWSGLSQGYSTTAELLASCELDENGKVFTATKVTELVAESCAASAQVYLYCRMMRKSRRHPHVQRIADRLLRIIDFLPTSGPLFTSQHKQFRVFVGAVVAVEARHRDIVRRWFLDLVNGTRGNVPPVWRAVQFMWEWLDARYGVAEAARLDESDIYMVDPLAEPWWEALVEEIYKREGMLNLA